MTRPTRHLAQIVGGPLGATRAAVVVRALTLAARRAGATTTVLSDQPHGPQWDTAPLALLDALPADTATVLHVGTARDADLGGAELPGRVHTVDHTAEGADLSAAAASWWRSVPPDPVQLALLQQHPGPHVVAVGRLGPATHSSLAIEAMSALVQHLRPDATAALLGSDADGHAPGLARQATELGLVACGVSADPADRVVRAHLARADAYIALGPELEDPAIDFARATGVPVVEAGPACVRDLAAAISVALEHSGPALAATPHAGDTWFTDLDLWGDR